MTLIMLLTIRLSGRKEENIPLICKRAHIIPYCKASSDEVKNLGHPQKHHSYLLSMWRPVKVKVLVAQLHSTLWNPAKLLCPWNSLGKNTTMGIHSLLQGIFPTPWSNLGLLHCRQILYHLSHHEAPVKTT